MIILSAKYKELNCQNIKKTVPLFLHFEGQMHLYLYVYLYFYATVLLIYAHLL